MNRIFQIVLLLGALVAAGCGGKPTRYWVERLKSGDCVERLHAVAELKSRTREAATVVDALIPVLADQEVFVRRDAARALGGFGAAARPAVPTLAALRLDPNEGVRQAAVAAVRQIDPTAADALPVALPSRQGVQQRR